MSFYDRPSMIKAAHAFWETHGQPFPVLAKRMFSTGGGNRNDSTLVRAVMGDFHWQEDRRPYYDIYSSVLDAFANTQLDLDAKYVKLPMDVLLIRCPRGNNIKFDGHELRTILVNDHDRLTERTVRYISEISGLSQDEIRPTELHNNLTVFADFGGVQRVDNPKLQFGGSGVIVHDNTVRLPSMHCMSVPTAAGVNVEDMVKSHTDYKLNDVYPDRPDVLEQLYKVIRIVVAVCLVGHNPRLVEPIVLDKDQLEFNRTRDEKLVKKAVEKGKRGWAIGRQLVKATGVVQPYWAIRWTGPGRQLPQLRPISGYVFQREKLGEIPTGYLDELEKPAT